MRLLALVNPSAGDGTAEAMVAAAMREVFAPAGVQLEVIITRRLGHAREFVAGLAPERLAALDGIVIVSGDGLIAEVIQGLASRPDGAAVLRATPIGALPAGSGNGLCKSLMHASGLRSCDPLDAARLICRGHHRALDLARVTLGSGSSPAVPSPFHSFLSVSWGLIGDVDIEADFLRPQLGASRFDPWFARRVRYPRLYRGQLHYRPVGAGSAGGLPTAAPALGEPLPTGWLRIEGPFLFLWACNVAWMTRTSLVAPSASPDDGRWQLVVACGAELADADAAGLQKLCMELAGAMGGQVRRSVTVVRTARCGALRCNDTWLLGCLGAGGAPESAAD